MSICYNGKIAKAKKEYNEARQDKACFSDALSR